MSLSFAERRLCGRKQQPSRLIGDVGPSEHGPESQAREGDHYSMSNREPPRASEQRGDTIGDMPQEDELGKLAQYELGGEEADCVPGIGQTVRCWYIFDLS